MAFFNELKGGNYWNNHIENSLLLFGRHIQNVVLSPDGVAIYRLVITENNVDQQAIQKIFYKFGPQVAIGMLSAYLTKQVEAKKIVLIDEQFAATQFIEMIKGPFIMRSLFGETIPEEELELALKQAVQIFLKGSVV